jgi:diguanylate cyclase (GGDEF)-like protein
MVIGASIAPVYLLLGWVDAFESFYQFTRTYEEWQIDELASLVLVLGVALGVFGLRRLNDLQAEVARRRTAESEATALARHDPLTGLPNRRHFLEESARLISELPAGEDAAVFVVDLDYFKPVNDLYGHQTGDRVLQEVAERLSVAMEGEGLVARLGGDEFAIFMPGIDAKAAERLARRLVHDLSQPIAVDALSVKIGVSIGATMTGPQPRRHGAAPQEADDRIHGHLRHADLAMYRAKTEGRGQYRFFEQEMDEKLKLHFQLEAELAPAIAARQIVPYYQQLVELTTGEVSGYEVLARWEHPIRGLIPPVDFIPIAEDTGLISKLTICVLEQAVEEAKNWPSHVYLSVNLSPRQLADRWLAQEILGILSRSGFPPRRLEVEITESGLVEKIDEVKAILESLRNVGIRVALDDFGTGYSGLYHLRELSIDTIKIDRSFVTHMLANREEEKIVEAVINLSNAMGIATIAEGVETPEVLERLRELGCKTGQGYYFGKPQDAKTTLRAISTPPGGKAQHIA